MDAHAGAQRGVDEAAKPDLLEERGPDHRVDRGGGHVGRGAEQELLDQHVGPGNGRAEHRRDLGDRQLAQPDRELDLVAEVPDQGCGHLAIDGVVLDDDSYTNWRFSMSFIEPLGVYRRCKITANVELPSSIDQ